MSSAEHLPCVALMLVKDDRVLAEKRRLTKRLAPGIVAIPGGHVEAGEALDVALRREAREELGIELLDAAYVCALLHHAEELREIHHFAVTSWTGAIVPDEAESVVWLGLDAPQSFDLEIDRTAVSEYLRLQREGGVTWRLSL